MSDWETPGFPESNVDGTDEWMSWISGNPEDLIDPSFLIPPSLAVLGNFTTTPGSVYTVGGGVDAITAGNLGSFDEVRVGAVNGNGIDNDLTGFHDGAAVSWDASSSTPFPPSAIPSTSSAPFPNHDPFIIPNASFVDPTENTTIPTAAYVPPASPWPNCRRAHNGSNKEQEEMLVTLRQGGMKFEKIAEVMTAEFGVEISANALVKRYQRTLDSYLLPVAQATKSAMPGIMAVIMRELGKRTDIGGLSEADRKALQGLEQDLPRIVQNRALRKRKAMLPADE